MMRLILASLTMVFLSHACKHADSSGTLSASSSGTEGFSSHKISHLRDFSKMLTIANLERVFGETYASQGYGYAKKTGVSLLVDLESYHRSPSQYKAKEVVESWNNAGDEVLFQLHQTLKVYDQMYNDSQKRRTFNFVIRIGSINDIVTSRTSKVSTEKSPRLGIGDKYSAVLKDNHKILITVNAVRSEPPFSACLSRLLSIIQKMASPMNEQFITSMTYGTGAISWLVTKVTRHDFDYLIDNFDSLAELRDENGEPVTLSVNCPEEKKLCIDLSEEGLPDLESVLSAEI